VKPSRKEIEELLGGKLPEEIPINELESWPPASDGSDGSGAEFEMVMFIKDMFSVYKKSLAGQIIGYYVYAFGFGLPIPSPFHIVSTTFDHVSQYSQIVYQRSVDPTPKPFDSYLVSVPREFPLPPSGLPLALDSLPTGTGVFPLSASDFAHLKTVLG
jgi:hypothetical protein